MNMRDNFNRRLPLLQPIGVRPIDVLEASIYRSSTAEWNAAMSTKYGDDWDAYFAARDANRLQVAA